MLYSNLTEPFFQKFAHTIDPPLNPQQKEALFSLLEDQNVLLNAGAGSGKTKTLCYCVGALLSAGVPANQILMLTFTRKAAQEMQERIESYVFEKSQLTGLQVSTFHSYAFKILNQPKVKEHFHWERTIFRNFSSQDSMELERMISRMKKQLEKQLNRQMDEVEFKAQEILKIYKKLRELPDWDRDQPQNAAALVLKTIQTHELTASFPKNRQTLSFIADVIWEFHYERFRQGLLDYLDLLLYTTEFLEEHTELFDQIKFVFVDEYQDINGVLVSLLNTIVPNVRNYMVVGDDAQAIYGFRGSDIRFIQSFEKEYSAKVINLEINYRSVPEIISQANNIMRNIEGLLPKRLKAHRQSNSKSPRKIECENLDHEAAIVINDILEHHKLGNKFKDHAILFRSGFQSRKIVEVLRQLQIPYEYRAGQDFTESKIVQDILSFFLVLFLPKRLGAWQRIFKLLPHVGDKTIEKLLDHLDPEEHTVDPKEQFLTEIKQIIKIPGIQKKAQKSIRKFYSFLKKISKLLDNNDSSLSASDFLDDIEKFLREITNNLKIYSNNIKVEENIEILKNIAGGFNKQIIEFINELSVEPPTFEESSTRFSDVEDKLVLSTIHQAKGLEWDHVYVIGLLANQFPHHKQTSSSQLNEEKRVFYVACTRAKSGLMLTYWKGYNKKPSKFMDYIEGNFESRLEISCEDLQFEIEDVDISEIRNWLNSLPSRRSTIQLKDVSLKKTRFDLRSH